MDDNVKKTDWGYEIVWANNEHYCSKMLVFEKEGMKTNLHFHKDRHKSWFVNSGKFQVQWVNTTDGKSYAQELNEGSVFHIEPLKPVLLKALVDNSVMAETSTEEIVNDYYRLG